MQLGQRFRGRAALIAGCGAVFWPGAFIFSFPGVMGPHWQETFQVGSAAVGQTLFFVLAAVGVFMFLIGRWQEKFAPARLAAIGKVLTEDDALRDAAFTLAAAIAFADQEIADAENELINELSDVLDLDADRADELLNQLEADSQ